MTGVVPVLATVVVVRGGGLVALAGGLKRDCATESRRGASLGKGSHVGSVRAIDQPVKTYRLGTAMLVKRDAASGLFATIWAGCSEDFLNAVASHAQKLGDGRGYPRHQQKALRHRVPRPSQCVRSCHPLSRGSAPVEDGNFLLW